MTEVPQLPVAPPIPGGDGEFFDVMLEAISYLCDGAWNGFEMAFEAIDAVHESSVSSSRDAARVLSALGHLDVQLDPRSLRPVAWSASPPTLLRIGAGEWLLSGRRPARLVAALAAEAERHGAAPAIEPVFGQPARITLRIPESAPDIAEVIVAAVRDQAHELVANPRGAACLARGLPTLGEVLDHLKRSAPAVGGSIERLQPDGRGGLKWCPVIDFAAPGAYRFDPPPVTYAYVDRHGALPVRVDARLARLLALLAAGMPPLAWDPETRSATAAYYAEPPALYERALALSSGYGPEPVPQERVTRYRAVTEEIAVAIFERLSTWESNGSR